MKKFLETCGKLFVIIAFIHFIINPTLYIFYCALVEEGIDYNILTPIGYVISFIGLSLYLLNKKTRTKTARA